MELGLLLEKIRDRLFSAQFINLHRFYLRASITYSYFKKAVKLFILVKSVMIPRLFESILPVMEQCPSNVNPVEYMLEAIGAGVMPSVGDQDWKDMWLKSQEFVNMKEEITKIKKTALLENLIAQSTDLSTRFCCIPTLNCQTSKDLAPDKRTK